MYLEVLFTFGIFDFKLLSIVVKVLCIYLYAYDRCYAYY